MTYRVVKMAKEFKVVEKETKHIVFRSEREITARELCRDLNLGSGFDGWTPSFFCNIKK